MIEEAMDEAERMAASETETAGTAKVIENTVSIVHKWFSSDDERQKMVQYAYSLWWLDFVKLIECENGNWNPKAISSTNDYGICQLNYAYNEKFILSEDYKDVYKQLDYCYNKYTYNPNLRYWPNRVIKGKKCKDYVTDRFIIN